MTVVDVLLWLRMQTCGRRAHRAADRTAGQSRPGAQGRRGGRAGHDCCRCITVVVCSNADLKPLGGIAPLIALLDCPNPEIQAAAMGVLATAASNNVKAQQDVAEECPNITDKLLQVSAMSIRTI